LGDYGSNLSYLIGFGQVALPLKINQMFYSLFYKDIMTPPAPFLETEPTEQVSKIVKADVRVRSSTEHSFKNLRVRRHEGTPVSTSQPPLSAEIEKGWFSILSTVIIANILEK
jgi:hypothetical protein